MWKHANAPLTPVEQKGLFKIEQALKDMEGEFQRRFVVMPHRNMGKTAAMREHMHDTLNYGEVRFDELRHFGSAPFTCDSFLVKDGMGRTVKVHSPLPSSHRFEVGDIVRLNGELYLINNDAQLRGREALVSAPTVKIDFKHTDTAPVSDANGFKKFDAGKSRLTLLPFKQLEQVADILAFGAEKYGLGNWLKGTGWSRFLDAALRHVTAFSRDEDNDPETGKSHLAHAICCLLFVMYYYDEDIGDDDRIES